MNDPLLAGVKPGFLELFDRKALGDALERVSATGAAIEPPADLILEPFRFADVGELLGVLVGQDPYPDGAAGLSFSKAREHKVPPSLRAVLACLQKSGRVPKRAGQHADLRAWAAQGLLMMNTALTTGAGECNAHQKIWKESGFVSGFLRALCEARADKPLFFILWGGHAKKFGAMAKKYGHEVFEWGHPSPTGDNKQPPDARFVNCTNFASVDAFLPRPFVWDNMATVYAFNDGSCPDNGGDNPAAAFGCVLLGGQFRRTELSGPVEPQEYALADEKRPDLGFAPAGDAAKPSNIRGEFLGFCWTLFALLRGGAAGRVKIFSDLDNINKTYGEWLPARKKKGTERAMKNYDLVHIGDVLLGALRRQATSVELVHCRSHQKKPTGGAELLVWSGNCRADELAKGAISAREVSISSRLAF